MRRIPSSYISGLLLLVVWSVIDLLNLGYSDTPVLNVIIGCALASSGMAFGIEALLTGKLRWLGLLFALSNFLTLILIIGGTSGIC